MSHAKEAELQKAFSLVDTDGTGRITEEEFYQMYRNQGRKTAQQQAVSRSFSQAFIPALKLDTLSMV